METVHTFYISVSQPEILLVLFELLLGLRRQEDYISIFDDERIPKILFVLFE